jgi:hypothetical protein
LRWGLFVVWTGRTPLRAPRGGTTVAVFFSARFLAGRLGEVGTWGALRGFGFEQRVLVRGFKVGDGWLCPADGRHRVLRF